MPISLRNFLYLDEAAVVNYLSVLEDGNRETVQREQSRAGNVGGAVGVSSARLEANRGREYKETEEAVDTIEAKYNRLVGLITDHPDLWNRVLQPSMLEEANAGEIVEVDADVYIPDVVKVLQRSSELGSMFDLMDALGELSGTGIQDMPSKRERDVMRSVMEQMPAELVVVAEVDDEWKVAGNLKQKYVRDPDLEGEVTIVGKVRRYWGPDEWKLVLALPGMTSLMPRDQRRKLEREGPREGEGDQFVKGPGLTLDVLAIYR
ncbi:DUF6414 family protein [Gordonia paraffinivorans]|uniref:DUF6414 family protein n=1 Tax=Gordonia paraffinivorans TaxID=175628 RepID=UPI00242FA556|nr:hypothetical protein [Gordonia paraffinivorans]